MTQPIKSIREILSRQSLLEYVPAIEIDRLAGSACRITYNAGETIFHKGEPGTSVISIESGRVRIVSYSAEDREVVLSVMGPGDIFGEIAVIDGGERSADAIAMEATEVILLDRDDFLGMLARNPQAALKLLVLLCERFRWTNEAVEDLNIFNLRPRLAKRLLSLCDQYGQETNHGTRITIPLQQRVLAQMMGSTREAVSRHLKAWEAAELIAIDHDFVIVRDRPALERIVRKLSPPSPENGG